MNSRSNFALIAISLILSSCNTCIYNQDLNKVSFSILSSTCTHGNIFYTIKVSNGKSNSIIINKTLLEYPDHSIQDKYGMLMNPVKSMQIVNLENPYIYIGPKEDSVLQISAKFLCLYDLKCYNEYDVELSYIEDLSLCKAKKELIRNIYIGKVKFYICE